MFILDQIGLVDAGISQFLAVILTPFTYYAYAIIAFTVLLSFAAHSILLMRRQAIKLDKELKEAQEIIQKSQDEASFTAQFGDINAGLSSLPILGHYWNEFVETLIPPLDQIQDDQYTVFRNTLRPDAYFKAAHITHLIKVKWRPETFIAVKESSFTECAKPKSRG